MAVSASLYDHTVKNMVDAVFLDGDVYRINLYTTATFTATHTTMTHVGTSATELTSAYGYTQGTMQLTSVAYTQTGNDAKFDASDVTWTATSSSIGPASCAVVWHDSTADSPVLFINFGENKTADAGTDFKITWATGGIVRFTYT